MHGMTIPPADSRSSSITNNHDKTLDTKQTTLESSVSASSHRPGHGTNGSVRLAFIGFLVSLLRVVSTPPTPLFRPSPGQIGKFRITWAHTACSNKDRVCVWLVNLSGLNVRRCDTQNAIWTIIWSSQLSSLAGNNRWHIDHHPVL